MPGLHAAHRVWSVVLAKMTDTAVLTIGAPQSRRVAQTDSASRARGAAAIELPCTWQLCADGVRAP